MDEKILIASAPVEVAEYPDYKLATFLISVLDEYDLNQRMIPRETAATCGETLIGAPILAKLIYNPFTGKPSDFGGHEVYWTTDDDGNDIIKFGTEPIGSVTKQWIEARKIDGFEVQKDCLMIQAKLWTSRFPEYAKVLDRLWNERKICSSWELTIHDAISTIQGRILKSVTFIGNCIIGCEPAVPQAGIVEYASMKDKTDELELMTALSKDIAARDGGKSGENDEKGNGEMEEKRAHSRDLSHVSARDMTNSTAGTAGINACGDHVRPETAGSEKQESRDFSRDGFKENSTIQDTQETAGAETPVVSEAETPAQNEPETPAVAEPVDPLFSYEIKDDRIVLSGCGEELVTELVNKANTLIENLAASLTEKDNALTEANGLVNDLKAQVAELTPFKEEHDRLEAEKAAAELQKKRDEVKNILLRSERVTEAELESDEFKAIIENADMASAKSVIADRFMASMPEKREVASVERPAPRVDVDDETFNMKKYLATRKY